MSFEGVNAGQELYKIILEKQYEDFSRYYIAEMSYDDFSCKVDVEYRIKHAVPILNCN